MYVLLHCHMTFKVRVFHLWQRNFTSYDELNGSPVRCFLFSMVCVSRIWCVAGVLLCLLVCCMSDILNSTYSNVEHTELSSQMSRWTWTVNFTFWPCRGLMQINFSRAICVQCDFLQATKELLMWPGVYFVCARRCVGVSSSCRVWNESEIWLMMCCLVRAWDSERGVERRQLMEKHQ